MLTRYDKILAAAISLLCILSVGLFFTGENQSKVIVTVDNKQVAALPLNRDGEKVITTPYGCNTVTVKGGKCKVTHTDCKNLICQKTAAISRYGESIVCAPHHLVAEVR